MIRFIERLRKKRQPDASNPSQAEQIEAKHARDLLEQKMKYIELQNQINPHFLYNTLENIRAQAFIDGNETIADMTEALSRFFRYNISKDNDVVHLSEELDNIQTYIQIQQYRFLDRFSFQIFYHGNEEAVLHCRIPKMTLQPIVENAISHGVENKIEQCHISVHIETVENKLILLVSDDGAGMEEKILDRLRESLSNGETATRSEEKQTNGDGIAIANINKRLKLLYGEEYGITSISSMLGIGTEVEITIPYKAKMDLTLEI